MQEKLFDILDRKIDKVETKLESLEEKIDALLSFKWQIVGGTLVVSFIVGVTMQIVLTLVGK